MHLSNIFCQLEWAQGSFWPFIYMEPSVLFIDVNGKLCDSSLTLDLLQYKSHWLQCSYF